MKTIYLDFKMKRKVWKKGFLYLESDEVRAQHLGTSNSGELSLEVAIKESESVQETWNKTKKKFNKKLNKNNKIQR